MKTLELFSKNILSIPLQTTWYLTDISYMQGLQELYKKQVLQKLKALREHAIIESAVSSNRIEGIEIDKSRIGTLVFGKPTFRDRNEEEVAGYRDALNLIHIKTTKLSISEKTLFQLHRFCRGDIWDAGKYKEKDVDIIQKYSNGSTRIRFKTTSPDKTPMMIKQIISFWQEGMHGRWIHPLILIGALNLDFLCIHPFRDGNGRVSRLLLLLNCYHIGIDVGRYISIERLIENNKERYYETLEESSFKWHEGKHNPWAYINFLLFIINSAYKEFKERTAIVKESRGTKTEIVYSVVKKQKLPFAIADIKKQCPGVSADMIRHLLKQLKRDGKVKCLGRGKYAQCENV
ncbi:MAG: cell filamentation protein Fic [Candidatus Fischerbacteria bacterium RBG_13_37_8]|uniref:Cell filamentation protein Fic n=1 Tax=Candidatus Fischerbacteria bacterium RBG_13_37_8 TaxID=1817863 RepID=A0A1F5VFC1_9BACT|nr:MAG: cell filamentation protein Fic [Candidatus Fischerbacteria bacterium RBG_13_37_8]